MVRAITVLFGLVFGGVFAGTGLYIALQTAVPMFLDYQTAKKWQPVSALLLSVSGDESSTSAKYEYQYNGRVYQGDRVHIARFNDNIGSYHADMQRRLNRSLETRNPVAIYVNPEMPGDAVLDRSMRWGMFSLATAFCSVFVLVGLLVMWSSFFVKPKSRKNPLPDLLKLRQEWKETSEARESFLSFLERRKRQLSLKEGNDAAREVEKDRAHKRLWQQKKGWETHRIRSDAKTGVVAMWFFALVWNSISFGLLFAMLKEWRHQDYMALLVLLFPLVGLLLFYQAVRKSFEYRRFGIVEYEMDPYPGAIGGNVGGAITINRLKRATTDFIVGLECVYSYVSGSGKNRSRSERIEWAEEGSAKAVRVVDGTRIDFSFSVPANLPESDIEQSGNYYFWRLKVRAVLKGVDLNRSYNIPVLATGELSQGRYRDISSLAKKEKQRQSEISKSAITSGRFNETVLAKSM